MDIHTHFRSDNMDTGHREGVDYTVRRSSKKHEKRIREKKKKGVVLFQLHKERTFVTANMSLLVITNLRRPVTSWPEYSIDEWLTHVMQ